mgnify:FL=1|tara:strand:+ start:509 stop:997 length:489 start_codon:yes stop_codon:yes gene_type:complete
MVENTGNTQTTQMGGLHELIGYNLRCAQIAVFQHFKKTVGNFNISPAQYGAMVLIKANKGISQSAIASALRFDRSTLVQIIDRLESRNLVVREASINDRRSYALRLTKSGSAMLSRLRKLVEKHEKYMTENLTDIDRQTLIQLLARVHKEVDDKKNTGGGNG